MTNEREFERNDVRGGNFGVPVETEPEQSIFDTSQAEPIADGHSPDVIVEDGPDVLKQVEEEHGAVKSGRGRRLAVAGFLLLAVVATAVIASWFLAGNGATKKARVPVTKDSAASDGDAATRQAIQELNAGSPGVSMGDGTIIRPQASPGASPTEGGMTSVPVTELPQSSLSQTAASEKSASSVAETDNSTAAQLKAVVVSGRNEERSVRIGADVVATNSTRREPEPRRDDRPVGVVVPSFGAMLPVKSLGVIYSLRSGALARFELTRDVKGKGWSLPHGTIIVGALRGSEYNRAYISLVGFIDSRSGKFVQVGGDLLGADGGVGVKGKRRQMSSKWSKVLRRLGEAGLNIAGRAIASVGRGPVIIADAYGGAATRFGNEFNGLLTTENRDSFVEIPAGTTCYIMITDLPEKVQGVEALSRWSGMDLQEKADTSERREATGLSEQELAELIQSGDLAKIKAALPRMTGEMRRLAESVLGEGSR